jgi:hypothetical protein
MDVNWPAVRFPLASILSMKIGVLRGWLTTWQNCPTLQGGMALRQAAFDRQGSGSL